VRGNERADALAGQTTVDSSLILDPDAVLGLFSQYFGDHRVEASQSTQSI